LSHDHVGADSTRRANPPSSIVSKARAAPGTAAFAHMPSGTTAFTKGVYALLEHHPPESGLGKQLAHLACHCENMPVLLENSRPKALALDRWWWSTIAYG
jgi:dTMP kinase